MDSLLSALGLALVAGVAIPLGGHAATIRGLGPNWLQTELRHSVIAFGGGVLIAAVALVLVPEGIKVLSPFEAVCAFAAGGIAFFYLDALVARRGGAASQFLAMLLDFVPEALALGAALATGQPVGVLLAFLMAFQNLPEGFNAFRELAETGRFSRRKILALFWLLALIGPLCAGTGYAVLAGYPVVIGAIMVFAAGGIVYLTFQDIAPQTALEERRAPALGAVGGFLLGLLGHMLIAA